MRQVSSVNAAILVALNVSADGMKLKSWWRSEIGNNAMEAKDFSINKQFIFGCHKAGMGLANADISAPQ